MLNLKAASPASLGGIRVGATLSITEDGTLDIRLDTDTFDESSPRPAASSTIAAWLRGKNYISQSDLQGKGLVSENRVQELLRGYQPRMGIDNVLPLTQEQYEALSTRDAATLYVIY